MSLLTAITGVIGGLGQAVAEPVTKYIEGHNKIKTIRAAGKQQIELAKIKAQIASIQKAEEHDLTYDMAALENQKTSWKDEYLTIVFTFPFILSFLSPFIDAFSGTSITPQVAVAWKTVGLAPDWYQWIMIGIVSSVYGLRWLFRQWNPRRSKKKAGIKKPAEAG